MAQKIQAKQELEILRKREERAKAEEKRISDNKKKTEDYYKKKEEGANSLLVFLYAIHNISYIDFFSFYFNINKNVNFIHHMTNSKFYIFGFLLIHPSTPLNLYFTL